MYANIFGTPIVAALLPDLGSDNILAIAGTGDGTFLRKPNLILQFTPYESQILEAIGYELDYGAGGKNTVFCGVGLEGDLYGSVTRAFKYAQQTMGIKVGTNVSVSATTTDATPQVLQLRNAGCRVLVFQAVGATTSAVAAAASQLGYAPQFIVTDTGYQTVKQDDPLYPYLSRHLIQVADMAPYGSKSVPGMADLVAAHDKYAAGTTPTIAYVGAWAMMAAVQQILEKAVAQKDLSQAALVKISSSFTKLDFGGIQAAFPWGRSAARKPPSTYTAYRPDASNPSGVAVIKANLSAPAPAVNYPY
jgi:ABC-type branched-subunit amino acid transport system substrate-binding protein